MKEIRLEHLTKRQVQLLNILWSLDTHDDVMQWMDTLSTVDRQQATSLMRMIMLQMLDDELEQNPDTYIHATQTVIKNMLTD
jgi:hypothetical protein